jgi:hypothetical protein
VLGAWTVTCIFHYRSWTGSIKPSMQHFQFCRVRLSLGILYVSILLSHPCYLCRVVAVKCSPVHLINDVIFSILEDRSAQYYCCVYMFILLKSVLRGVDGNLHFPLPSINKLNQTEPATFSIMSCWAFFGFCISLFYWFDWVWSWTVLDNTSNRPRPLGYLKLWSPHITFQTSLDKLKRK